MASFAGKVLKDGRISTADLSYVVDLALKFDKIVAGFDNFQEALSEAKDLDKSEVIEILGQAYAVVASFEDAKKR